MSERIPAEAFPPWEFIENELEARGMTLDDLAWQMTQHDYQVNRLMLDFYHALKDPRVFIDDKDLEKIGEVFGTGTEYWENIQNSYRNHPNTIALVLELDAKDRAEPPK